MKRIILFCIFIFATITAQAEGWGTGLCPLFDPSDPNWCAPLVGKSAPSTQLVNGTHPILISDPAGKKMVSTHMNHLFWSAYDATMYTTAASTLRINTRWNWVEVRSRYATPVRGQGSLYTAHYWIANPFGNGTEVSQQANWVTGMWIEYLGGFIPGWFYNVRTSPYAPITKI